MSKEIRFNAFVMNSLAHLAPGQWTAAGRAAENTAADPAGVPGAAAAATAAAASFHPAASYLDPDHWIELARTLERGLFDSLFLGDVLGVYAVDTGSADLALRCAAQAPMNDPFPLIPLMSQATTHLGFGVTASVTYEPPYLLARRLTTLDHLTRGRVAWNIVTSYLESGARSLGLDAQIAHDDRYDRADDYLTLCYKLWEGSWEDGAVRRDRATGVYADPAKIHAVGHDGPYYRSHGVFQCEPSPQRTPLLFQAGGSTRGKRFAADHAECIFVGAPTRNGLKRSVDELRAALAAAGRPAGGARFFAMFTVIVEPTSEEAQATWRACLERASFEGARALLSGWTGIDLSKYRPGDTLSYVDTDAGQSALASFSKLDPERVWTVRDAVDFVAIGGRGPVVVGNPREVADALQGWMDDTGIDGFNLADVETPKTFRNIVELLVPELQRRGVYKNAYTSGTLREKMFGQSASLAPTHGGSRFKVAARDCVVKTTEKIVER
jgi:FMN-dependent oxidoreductase (nitrilotriacetate monooxygenase family)